MRRADRDGSIPKLDTDGGQRATLRGTGTIGNAIIQQRYASPGNSIGRSR